MTVVLRPRPAPFNSMGRGCLSGGEFGEEPPPLFGSDTEILRFSGLCSESEPCGGTVQSPGVSVLSSLQGALVSGTPVLSGVPALLRDGASVGGDFETCLWCGFRCLLPGAHRGFWNLLLWEGFSLFVRLVSSGACSQQIPGGELLLPLGELGAQCG